MAFYLLLVSHGFNNSSHGDTAPIAQTTRNHELDFKSSPIPATPRVIQPYAAGPKFEFSPPNGIPSFDNLEECIRGSQAHQCQFNMGKEYECLRTYGACLKEKSENILSKALSCKHEFQVCRIAARQEYKFNCHDYAFESCRQLKRAKFPAWIFGVCDTGNVGGHAMVIVRDLTAPAAKQPYYCIHEPQRGAVDRELCWTSNGTLPEIPKSMIDVLERKISGYARLCRESLKVHKCDESYYSNRGESPWYACSPSGYHTDPLKIPRWVPPHPQ